MDQATIRCIVSDASLTEEERDMRGFDYKGLASFKITHMWKAVFDHESNKANKQDRINAYHFFMDDSGEWAMERRIWAESYLDLNPAMLKKQFTKEFKLKKHKINMPIVHLKSRSINRLNGMYESYVHLCSIIEKDIRYFHKNTFIYGFELPKLMKMKREYDKIFKWTLKGDWINNIPIKMGQQTKNAEYWYREPRIQRHLILIGV